MGLSRVRDLATVVRSILHHLDTKYLRKRCNGPRQSLIVLLTAIQSGMNRIGIRPTKIELGKRLSTALGWADGKMPSTSSISRAIRKLKSSEIMAVIEVGLTSLVDAYGKDLLIHGHWILAIDGVRVNAQRTSPLARWLHLPRQGKGKRAHQPQALVVVARCVVTGVVVAQEIVRHSGSERACAKRLANRLGRLGKILVLLDRGFPSRDLLGFLDEKGIAYVVRMCGGEGTWRELQGHMTGSARDEQIEVRLRNAKGKPLDQVLRFLLSRPIKRGRPACDRTPHRLALFTNLTGRYWSFDRIIALYHRRWDIETGFREDKRLLGATKSHATTRNGFTNEILALWVYRILMALIAAQVACEDGLPRWDDPRALRLSTPQLILAAWWIVEEALVRSLRGRLVLDDILRELRRDAARRRPGRHATRITKGVEGVWKSKVERGRR